MPSKENIGQENTNKEKEPTKVLTDAKIIEHHIDNIKTIRQEINWRVKLNYNAHLAFISVLIFTIGFSFNGNAIQYRSGLEEEGATLFTFGIIAIIFNLYVGVLAANALVEKRLELYILKLQEKIIELSKGNPLFSWLSFLYGSQFTKGISHFTAKIFDASLSFYQFILPLLGSTFITIFIFFNKHGFRDIQIYPYFYVYLGIVFLLVLTIAVNVYLFIFTLYVSKEHKNFYKTKIVKYLDPEKDVNSEEKDVNLEKK